MTNIHIPEINIHVMGPEVTLLAAALAALLFALFVREGRGGTVIAVVGVLGVLVALVLTALLMSQALPAYAFGQSFVLDTPSAVMDLVILMAALAALLTAPREMEVSPDFAALVLWSAVGMMLLVGANDLIVLFLGVEIVSLPLYILAAFRPERGTSLEAAVKYFLLGAFSSGFLLYGLAFLYGATGSTNLETIGHAIAQGGSGLGGVLAAPLLLKIGLALVIVGLGFKLALVPFHMWVPDVYEGSPTPVTTFMSVGTKAAAFGALARVLFVAVPVAGVAWEPVIFVLAILTILLGALLTLPQTNMKRLLAYSGILNAGYVAATLTTGAAGLSSALYFLVAYALMNLGAFTVVTTLSTSREEGSEMTAYRGLYYRNPWIAVAMSVFLLSLASIPPTAGFLAKFYILKTLVAGQDIPLAVALVVGTAITLYTYARPVISMFQRQDEEARPAARVPVVLAVFLAVLAIGVIGVGVAPGGVLHMIDGGGLAGGL